MNNQKQLLGSRIKELRSATGLTQAIFSEKVGIESKYLSRIEVGSCYPSLEVLERIADALQVEMKELFDYLHHDNRISSPEGIANLTKNASADELKLIARLVKSVLR